MAGRFPGASSIDQYWQNLVLSKETIAHFTKEELINASVPNELLNNSNYIRARGILNNVDKFDAGFFGFSPYEAGIMDPQQRIFLEISWEALENAGYGCFCGKDKIGIFAGAGQSSYLQNILLKNETFLKAEDEYQTAIVTSCDFLASRVAYHLNLTGPVVGIQTACSTSLVAIAMASQALIAGECDMALAGGVSIYCPQVSGYLWKEGSVFSKNAHCRPFDNEADGIVLGNGAGVVVLKRLDDAVQDRDHIDAVIISSAINNDGSNKVCFTAPSVSGQAECVIKAIEKAKINSERIGYLEAHGTGTPLGDPIEIAALTRAFNKFSNQKQFCPIGSVKSNIGHLDAAAGVAGFIKTVLAMKNKKIPASINFNKPNANIDFNNSPFFVNSVLRDWESQANVPRIASVNSLGMGGTNVHVLIEEFISDAGKKNKKKVKIKPYIFCFSAKTEKALSQYEKTFSDYLNNETNKNLLNEQLGNIAYTLQVGRKQFDLRSAFVSHSYDDMINILKKKKLLTNTLTKNRKSTPPKIVFMYSGQGTHYVNMGKELYQTELVFKESMDLCFDILKEKHDIDLQSILFPEEKDFQENQKLLTQTEYTQIAVFIIEYALTQLLLSWNVHPSFVIGHSLGEYTAAQIAGIFSLEDVLSILYFRGKLFNKLPRGGAMLAVGLSADQVKPLLDSKISIAVTNTPELVTISGPTANIERFRKQALHKFGGDVFFKPLKVSHAFHSPMVETILEEFSSFITQFKLHDANSNCAFVSTVNGDFISSEELSNHNYWVRHLRSTVKFSSAAQKLLQQDNVLFLEIGAGAVLCDLLRQQNITNVSDIFAMSTLPAAKEHNTCCKNGAQQLYEAISYLWVNHAIENINNRSLNDQKNKRLPLPTYPFEKKRFWMDGRSSELSIEHSLSEGVNLYSPVWNSIHISEESYKEMIFNEHQTWLIFLDQFGLGSKIADLLRKHNQQVVLIKEGSDFKKDGDFIFSINPPESLHFRKVFDCLLKENINIDCILHFCSLSEEVGQNVTIDSFKKHQLKGLHSLIALSQTFLKNVSHAVKLFVVTNNVKKVLKNDLVIPEKTTLLGPCLTIPQEFPYVSCSLIDVDYARQNSSEHLPQILLKEFLNKPKKLCIAVRSEFRCEESFTMLSVAEIQKKAPKIILKEGGVYLITGGLGKIGLEVALHLAKKYCSTFILVSRREFIPREKWTDYCNNAAEDDQVLKKIKKINDIERLGSHVVIFSADISKLTAVENLHAELFGRFKGINGIIHAAGYVGKGAAQNLISLDIEKGNEHFLGKDFGIIEVLRVFDVEQLDFLVLFSSISTFLGGLNMTFYIAANAFLDALAEYLSLPNLKVINWDAWENSAAPLSFPVKNLPHRLELTKREALQHFDSIFKTDQKRIILAKGDLKARYNKWINPGYFNNYEEDIRETLNVNESCNLVCFQNTTEKLVAALFVKILGVASVSREDDFFNLGGHSLLAVRLIVAIEKAFKISITVNELMKCRTVEMLSMLLQNKCVQKKYNEICVPLREGDSKTPLFLFHHIGGTAAVYTELVKYLRADRPVYGLQDPSLGSKNLQFNDFKKMSAAYLQEIRRIQPKGPYLLAGASMGATLAFEVGHQLTDLGEEIAFMGMFDGWALFSERLRNEKLFKANMQKRIYEEFMDLPPSISMDNYLKLMWVRMKLLLGYMPPQANENIRVTLYKAEELLPEYQAINDDWNHWNKYISDLNVIPVPGNHESMIKSPYVRVLVKKIDKKLDELKL